MEDVISLVSSSDEEDNNGMKKIKPKSVMIKKTKPKSKPALNKITPTQNITLPQKIANTSVSVVRIPQNNNTKQNITLLHGYKQPKSTQLKLADGNSLDIKKTSNLSSGITITPLKGIINVNSQGNKSTPKTSLITAKPKQNPIILVPKPNVVTFKPSIVTSSPVNVPGASRPAKRINPIKISDNVTNRASSIEKSSDSDMLSRDSSVAANDDTVPQKPANGTNQTNENSPPATKRPRIDTNQKPAINNHYKELMEACKASDSSEDVGKVIDKLEKYYYRAHPDYLNSKSFHKLVNSVTNDIKSHPNLMYMKITNLLDELKTRRTVEGANPVPENPKEAEVNEKKKKRIQQLSDALRKLQRKIRQKEEAEVDWEDEHNSNYLMTERLKKRAFEIYEKLCDLTGESRNAERIVKKPIKFRGTDFPEFNRKLEKFVNEKNTFPDMFDVLRIMDYCNTEYKYRLSVAERRDTAQDAFTKIGNLLQDRRKRDLYEMVQYYTSNANDPAREDPSLKSKLEDNHRHFGSRMDEVIDKFTRRQRRDSSEDKEDSPPHKDKQKASSSNSSNVPTTSSNSPAQTTTPITPRPQPPQPLPHPMKMDTDLDINDTDIDLIIPDDGDGDGLRLIDDEAMQEIEKEIPTELFPTITSVTSLHPSVDRFNEFFDAGALEPSNIL